MKTVTVLILLCFGARTTSSEIYGNLLPPFRPWPWSDDDFFVKFDSPCGKTFYIKTGDGTIYLQGESILPSRLEQLPRQLPFMSFVSIDFKMYDIYFENDDINSYHPRLVESELVCKIRDRLVRPRLDSFVGPNMKVYKVTFSDGNKVDVAEQSSEALDHFQIKTFGPFEKWEHTYVFSENREMVEDHTISPVPVLANRSILLPELEPNFIEKSHNRTVLKFNSPSGRKYFIKDLQNIIGIRHYDEEETAYITFTDLNGRTYDIHIDEEDGHASLVARNVDENYVGRERLYSFVAPNGIMYRINYGNGSDNEVPVLVSNSSDSSDLQIALLQQDRDYNKYVKYIFSDNGNRLFDRVDEIDWTPLNELPALYVNEVTEDDMRGSMPYLSLYTPSGNTYHVHRNGEIVVEKGANHSQSLYISYLVGGKKKANIYFVPGADPYLEEEDKTDRYKQLSEYSYFDLFSFSTPDQKAYSVFEANVGETWKYIIETSRELQVPQANGLFIRMKKDRKIVFYKFTWNGDKLVEAINPGLGNSRTTSHRLPKTIISLIGK